MTDRGPLEDRLSSLATMQVSDERRARSWHRVRSTLREPAPRRGAPLWWRPLGLASAIGVAAAVAAFVLLQPPRAVVAAVHGVVAANVDGRQVTLRAGDQLPAGTRIETSATSWVALRVGDDRFSVDTESLVVLRDLSKLPARVVVEQATGRTWHVPAHDPQREYVVRTDSGEAIARGAAFLVVSRPGAAPEVVTVEGSVQVASPAGSILVSAGQLTRLTAAPPTVEDAPTATLGTPAGAGLTDALGRTCDSRSRELPGCVPSASGFVLLPGAARDVRIRVEATGPRTVDVVVAGQRTQVAVPGSGIFEIKVELTKDGTQVKVEVKDRAEEVDEEREERVERHESPKPSRSPRPSRSPEPSETAEPPKRSETLEPSKSPKPSETAGPSKSPNPSATVEVKGTPEPTKTPEASETAEPTKAPEPARTPEPTKASETEKPETPRPSPTRP